MNAVLRHSLQDEAPSTVTVRMPSAEDDDRRGTMGMRLFIFTEAMLFVMLFWVYAYLGHGAANWPPQPPELPLPLAMLAVLLASSAVLHWGERQGDRGETRLARLAVFGTALLGVVFLVLQSSEYAKQWAIVTPMTSAYGSIFYLLTGAHGAHVAVGVCMLLFVGVLPRIGRTDRSPYRPVHNVAMYWHFVDVVWIVLVAVLYVWPHVWSGR